AVRVRGVATRRAVDPGSVGPDCSRQAVGLREDRQRELHLGGTAGIDSGADHLAGAKARAKLAGFKTTDQRWAVMEGFQRADRAVEGIDDAGLALDAADDALVLHQRDVVAGPGLRLDQVVVEPD